MSRPNPAAAREMAQSAVERMGPAALEMTDAWMRLVESFGILRSEAIAIVGAERARRAG